MRIHNTQRLFQKIFSLLYKQKSAQSFFIGINKGYDPKMSIDPWTCIEITNNKLLLARSLYQQIVIMQNCINTFLNSNIILRSEPNDKCIDFTLMCFFFRAFVLSTY